MRANRSKEEKKMLDKETEPAVDMALKSSAAVEGMNADLPLYDSLLAKGKRNLMCKEIPEAVNQLQEAARLVAEKFGETANECAEVYLQYGMALLELARMENTVLGNALTGIPAEPAGMEEENVTENTFVEPDETTEEEKAKISDEIIDAMIESEDQDKNSVSEEGKDCSEGDKKDPVPMESEAKNSPAENVDSSETDKPAKEVTGKEDSDKVEEDAKGIEGTAGEDEGEEDEEDNGEETEDLEENTEEATEEDEKEDKNNISQDEVTNLQLAWEMIELSKSIYKRGELEDSNLKQAECMVKLGEIGLETEQYVQAVSDFQECITILESVVEPSSRRLAETHYQMALAHGYNEAFDDAISQFQRAISIIELKITELNSFIHQSAGNEVTEEALEAARKELEDLQNLIPDIKIKIDDAKEEKKAQGLKEVIRQSFKSDLNGDEGASNAFQNGASSSASLSAAPVKPVQDITHLVRKKRDMEESEAIKSDEKKHKADDEVKDSELRSNGSVELTPGNSSLEAEIVGGSVKILPMETGSI